MRSDNPFLFLIETLFDLYIIVLMLRFLLQQVRADFYNPISQFIVKATSPVLNPARKFIPGIGGIDLATIIVIVLFIVVWSEGLLNYFQRKYHQFEHWVRV